MANKIDQIFRENLDQLELKPSAEAWSKVKGQVAVKKPKWVWSMRVAAAVLVIATATLVLTNNNDESEKVLAVDYPAADLMEERHIEVPQYLTQKEEAHKPVMKKIVTKEAKQPSNQVRKENFEAMQEIAVARLDQPKVEADIAPKNLNIQRRVKVEEDTPYIKITYIASSGKRTPPEEVKDDGKLIKVIALAREVSSSDILADFREAKDNLFRRNN